jgi:arginine/lysine/ornithine decarboxylase
MMDAQKKHAPGEPPLSPNGCRSPLIHVLSSLADSRPVRMHVPGHKGKDLFSLDFTELPVTGDLYRDTETASPLRQAETLWAEKYHAAGCCFLTGGSSQGVAAALAALTVPGETILLDRYHHTSFTHAMALLDLHPVFLPRPVSHDGLFMSLPPRTLEAALHAHPNIKTVCITSPTYYGEACDIAALSSICRRYHARLFVDAAHGAHFPWAELGSPAAGADIFVCSLHKTLPALGQSAALFTNVETHLPRLRRASAWFGTSSPSYVLMASIDAAYTWLTAQGAERWRQILNTIRILRSNYDILSHVSPYIDPFRLTMRVSGLGYTGYEVSAIWQKKFNLWSEMCDERHVVCITGAADEPSDFTVLESALSYIYRNRRSPLLLPDITLPLPQRACSPRAALLSASQTMRLAEADGLTAADDILHYPPGVPICAAGEVIDTAALTAAGLAENMTVAVMP